MSNEEQKELNIVKDKKVVGGVDLPKFEAEPYVGTEHKIDSADIIKGEYGYYYNVRVLIDPKCKEIGDKPLYASKNLGLVEQDDGSLVWGNESKTAQFLERMKVSNFEELIGKTVKLQRQGETEYLTF